MDVAPGRVLDPGGLPWGLGPSVRVSLPGGGFGFTNNGTDFGALTTTDWDCAVCESPNVWFKADLTSVPEPAFLLLLGIGLFGLGLMRWRRAA
jgi:hypothetical protein